MFNIDYDKVEPIFTLEESLGDIYVVDDIFSREGITFMFLGYSPKKDRMYTFNMSDCRRKSYVEYVVFETTFNQINRSCNYKIEAVELMYEASLNGDLYILMLDIDGYEELERMNFGELSEYQIPQRDTYFKYNKSKINRMKRRN